MEHNLRVARYVTADMTGFHLDKLCMVTNNYTAQELWEHIP